MKRFLLLMIILLALSPGTRAEEEKVLTKGEAIEMLSAADFMRKKIGDLLSWGVGYDVSRVNRVRLVPVINYIKAEPRKLPPDNRTILDLYASVDDPAGLKNISGVRADLSSLGRFSNMMLVDNGLWGDEVAGDGIYTLQASVNDEVALGDKEIVVAASNKKGWLAVSKTSIAVEKNPTISSAQASPDPLVLEGDETPLTLTVKVDNPGRPEDIKGVYVDLRPLNLGSEVEMDSTDSINFLLEVRVPSTVPAGTKRLSVRTANFAGGYAAAVITLGVNK
ncbi:hypothetical protein HZC35_04940 [Candidatus Saganbacteria bacterium]|nr:hypothetical protein [Candidatus Saganbacteria bacterium]